MSVSPTSPRYCRLSIALRTQSSNKDTFIIFLTHRAPKKQFQSTYQFQTQPNKLENHKAPQTATKLHSTTARGGQQTLTLLPNSLTTSSSTPPTTNYNQKTTAKSSHLKTPKQPSLSNTTTQSSSKLTTKTKHTHR